MIKNSTGAAWKKLIQTCKYFFSKNSLVPVNSLLTYGSKTVTIILDENVLDLSKGAPKLWIYDAFYARSSEGLSWDDSKAASLSISKILKFNLRILHLSCQDLTVEEYHLLTASGTVEALNLVQVSIMKSDGVGITFDKLFDNLQNLKEFTASFRVDDSILFESDTVKKVAEILPRLQKLHKFYLHFLRTTSFDFASFSDFLLKNETVNVDLSYFDDITGAYREMIETFIEKIIQNPPKRIPKIDLSQFDEVEFAKYHQLCNLQNC
uniref:Uncharacterized protein n=1 Tax=Panagrolaimus sp. ES5 TaxID=591445 RepID=A0AC34FLQ3_9BILA